MLRFTVVSALVSAYCLCPRLLEGKVVPLASFALNSGSPSSCSSLSDCCHKSSSDCQVSAQQQAAQHPFEPGLHPHKAHIESVCSVCFADTLTEVLLCVDLSYDLPLIKPIPSICCTKSQQPVLCICAGMLVALMAGQRGLASVQLWNGWDPARGQPIFAPFALTLLTRALTTPGGWCAVPHPASPCLTHFVILQMWPIPHALCTNVMDKHPIVVFT